jgi:PAS domain S-box-containing protein
MRLEDKREAILIGKETRLTNMKNLLELEPFPLVVLDDSNQVIGVAGEKSFWKAAATLGWDSKITSAISTEFLLVHEPSELKIGNYRDFKYFVWEYEGKYKVYSSCELREQSYGNLVKANTAFQETLDELRNQSNELKEILHASYDEIYVTDADGNTLFISDSCQKVTGYPAELFLGKKVKELVGEGIINDSVTLKVMSSKETESAQQTYPSGLTVIATAKPIFDQYGNLSRIITNTRDVTELIELRHQLAAATSGFGNRINLLMRNFFDKLVTRSDKMLPIIELVEKVARSDASILIEGESGVGKGIIASIIHDLSDRKEYNFVHVNCGAIPANLMESELFGYEAGSFTGANKHGKSGLVEEADKGTLFLDEIGELPLDLQVKLLHLVQDKAVKRVGGTKEKKVDIRIISATNKNLEEMVKNKLFREDLYYRLHVIPIMIPSLRERREDIPLLIEHFLSKFNTKYAQNVKFAESSMIILQSYHWPGNVRELEHFVERMVVTARESIIYSVDLPALVKAAVEQNRKPGVEVFGILSLKEAIEETERQILTSALQRLKTSRKIAAELQTNQTTVIRKLHKYRLKFEN